MLLTSHVLAAPSCDDLGPFLEGVKGAGQVSQHQSFIAVSGTCPP